MLLLLLFRSSVVTIQKQNPLLQQTNVLDAQFEQSSLALSFSLIHYRLIVNCSSYNLNLRSFYNLAQLHDFPFSRIFNWIQYFFSLFIYSLVVKNSKASGWIQLDAFNVVFRFSFKMCVSFVRRAWINDIHITESHSI